MKPTVEAMLCASGTEKDLDNPNNVSETKWDGTRIWAGKYEGEPFVLNRENVDYTTRLTEVVTALDFIPSEDVIFDGEAVVFDANGRTNFKGSQSRCSTTNLMKQKLAKLKYPIIMQSFDLIRLDGKDLRNQQWQSRNALLRDLLEESLQETVRLTVSHYEDKRQHFDEAVALGEEGVIVKDIHSVYVGKESKSWRKVKHWNPERCLVVGYTEGTGRREEFFGSLILARADDQGHLKYCGKVGTGFNDAELRKITGILRDGEIENDPVDARDSNDKRIDYTPVSVDLEVTIKFYESSERGVFRFPSMLKDENGRSMIHYGRSIMATPGPKQADLKTLLDSLTRGG